MKHFVRGAFLAVMMMFSGAALAEDAAPADDPARMAAARDLLEETGVTKQFESMKTDGAPPKP
jgi:hypothetical protein